MLSSDEHDVCRRAADFCAGRQQAKVFGLYVFAALFKAVRHRRAGAGLVAVQAFIDARLHIWGGPRAP